MGNIHKLCPILCCLPEAIQSFPISQLFPSSQRLGLQKYCCFCPPAPALCMKALCAMYFMSIPPKSEPTSTSLDALEVFYKHSANSRGYGIPKPPCFMLWPRISLRSVLTYSSPKSAGKKASLRESSIGPIIVPATGIILCRYCHLI